MATRPQAGLYTIENIHDFRYVGKKDDFKIVISHEILYQIMSRLTGSELKLYFYLLTWIKRDEHYLTTPHVKDCTGICKYDTLRKAREGLERLGILKKVGRKCYEFCPVPDWVDLGST